MPQQTEVLVQQGVIKASRNNLLSSIDEAIEHFEDYETQIILKKYGFDVNSLLDDLNDSKDWISQLINDQQSCHAAVAEYIHSNRSLGWMSEDCEAIIQQCREEIIASIEFGGEYNSKLENFAFELKSHLSKYPEKHKQVIQELKNDKQKEINAENEYSDKVLLYEKYDVILRRIDDIPEK
ncbi:hypothetical protein [Calothrix sp. NIES-2098]|uniref:hypothetical protein n=1 Tax=Calothrix sp. NIES-2098 TaxID=1954171 RepID=UPI000B612BA2|nr:hypothetical protein NIES2098_02030 [Calothrix sp. NIES-2098]